MDKVLCKIVNAQLLRHLEQNNLLSSYQYGFRQNSNTTTALVDLTNEIQKKRDLNKIVVVIFIDLKKAFDAQ